MSRAGRPRAPDADGAERPGRGAGPGARTPSDVADAEEIVADVAHSGRSSTGAGTCTGPGATSARDVHGTDRAGMRGVDVKHVWQNGEMYIQRDGQVVKVLDNGNGTYDVVVRDMSNPSGAPTTVLKDATARYVHNKIESGQWE